MSRHLRPGNGAGESFVSFIALFDSKADPASSAVRWIRMLGQSLPV
jgi:hypothetical protein